MSNEELTANFERVRSTRTLAECAPLFRSIVEPLGFDSFAAGVVDLEERNRSVFYLIDWPERWRQYYVASGFLTNDPVVSALHFRGSTFTWSELRSDRKMAEAGREALERVAAEGWNEGLVVPIFLSEHRVGIVSLSGPNPLITKDIRAYLQLLSTLFLGHLRKLVARHGFALPPVGLTQREIVCLRLVAQGLSDNAIARVLQIAPSTAHEFVEKAKARFKVRSRAKLVAIAVELGIVSV